MTEPTDAEKPGEAAQQPQPQSEPQPQSPPEQSQGQSPLPQPDFLLLLQMFFEQALFAMGQIPGLPESEQKVDLNLARFQIGLLEVLKEKTKGNLGAMEEKFLEEYLHQARLAFLTVSRQGAPKA